MQHIKYGTCEDNGTLGGGKGRCNCGRNQYRSGASCVNKKANKETCNDDDNECKSGECGHVRNPNRSTTQRCCNSTLLLAGYYYCVNYQPNGSQCYWSQECQSKDCTNGVSSL